MKSTGEYQEIFNRNVALKLRDMGNTLYDAIPNIKHQGLVVYIFKNSEKLQHDMAKIFKK